MEPLRRPFPSVRRPQGEGGIALLLVLILSLILLPFAQAFTVQVQLESRTALNVTDQLKIENALDGQFEIMLARLQHDVTEGEIDTLDDSWNDQELRERLEDVVGVALTTHPFDEQSKLNIRAMGEGSEERRRLIKARLQNLLLLYRRGTPHELSQGEAEAWTSQVFEYVNKGPARANLPTPRMADGRTINILEELMVLPEIDGHRIDFLLNDQREGDEVSPGLHRYVTVFGNGKINLNTTDLVVVQALFGKNPELAERILDRRNQPPTEEDEGTPAPPPPPEDEEQQLGNPYTDVNQVSEVEGVTAKALEENQVDLGADFDVRSHFYSLRIVAETGVTRRDELFVVERVPGAAAEDPLEGFRFLLRQERTDPLEAIGEQDP